MLSMLLQRGLASIRWVDWRLQGLIIQMNGPLAGSRSMASPPASRAACNQETVMGCRARLAEVPVVFVSFVIADKTLEVKV
jgi:hypothetical protein